MLQRNYYRGINYLLLIIYEELIIYRGINYLLSTYRGINYLLSHVLQRNYQLFWV